MRAVLLTMMLWLAMSGGVSTASAQQMTALEPQLQIVELAPSVPDEWQVIDGPWLRVYGHSDTLPVLMHLAEVGSLAVPKLAEQLGVPIGGTIHVIVAPTYRSFIDLQPGGVPEYADGTAWPGRGHIYLQRPGIRSGEKPLEQVLQHEIVHILLGRAFAPAIPPSWLQEGTATVLAGELDGEMSRSLIVAVAGGHEPSLAALSHGFPRTQPQASLAYAESADFIVYLQQNYGDDVIAKLVYAAAGGASLPAAVHQATGGYLHDIEPAWKRRFHNGALAWLTVLGSWEMWWAAGGLVAMVGLVLARRRSRGRLEAMAAEEARLDALLARLWGTDPAG